MNKYLEEVFEKSIGSIVKLTNKTMLLTFTDQNKLIIKKRDKPSKVYRYLKGLHLEDVSYPIKHFIYDNTDYYAYQYYPNNQLRDDQMVLILKEKLMFLHEHTLIEKPLKKQEFKKLYRLYKKLDYKYSSLELLVRECELREKKTDFDWVILSKYSTFLDVKKEMYSLQMKIHNFVDQKISVYYAINHGNPTLSHVVSERLISFDNSYLGVVSSDIAKFYVCNEDVNIDWEKTIESWMQIYEGEFYSIYFKFLVLFLLILNFNIDLVNQYETLNNYIAIHHKLLKSMTLFKNIH